jgi:hypothetical protein
VQTVSRDEALDLLKGTHSTLVAPDEPERGSGLSAEGFIKREFQALERLRDILGGKASAAPGEVDELVERCDYLWAHFPECAGAGGRRPPLTDLSFMKRLRTEIEPFMKALSWGLT